MVISLGQYQMYRNKSFHWYSCPKCGEITLADVSSFKNRKSCGCWRPDTKKHGHFSKGKETPTYLSWKSMKTRCDKPKTISYKQYGAQGITYIPAWSDFSAFLADMGERPPDRTLDRIESSKGYYKENCRWATKLQQTQNRRNTIKLKISANVELTAKEISTIIGIGHSYIALLIRSGRAQYIIDRIYKITGG